MKTKILISILSLLVIACGCTGPRSYTDQAPVAEGQETKDWRKIEVVNIDQIKKDYEIIGKCVGDGWLDDVIDLKKQAARLGADAISIPKPNRDGSFITCEAIRYKTK